MKHGIENNQEFAHTGDERGLGVLTIGTQPQIESSDGGIAANSRYRRHIQDATDLGASTPDTTTAAHASTVAVKWCQTGQCGDLLAFEHSKFKRSFRPIMPTEYQQLFDLNPKINLSRAYAVVGVDEETTLRRICVFNRRGTKVSLKFKLIAPIHWLHDAGRAFAIGGWRWESKPEFKIEIPLNQEWT